MASASFTDALQAKRIRRQYEPETKNWNDAALDTVWDDVEGISRHSVFAMKNIFFFSHATEVQSKSIPVFVKRGTSAVVEAATGSGKTIAFLVPLLERICAAAEQQVAGSGGRPTLHRKIVGVVLSPSRVLAEQTFLVAKNLACRFPFNIRVALCDGIVEKAPRVVAHLRRVPRGAGTVLVTTPEDLLAVLDELSKPPKDDDEEEEEESGGGGNANESTAAIASVRHHSTAVTTTAEELPMRPKGGDPHGSDDGVCFAPSDGESPFVLIVDEADVVMRSALLRGCVDDFLVRVFSPMAAEAAPERRSPLIDFGFFGATVGSSKAIAALASGKMANPEAADDSVAAPVTDQDQASSAAGGAATRSALPAAQCRPDVMNDGGAELDADGAPMLSPPLREILRSNKTTFTNVVLHDDSDFVSQLANRYIACPFEGLLASLIHVVDLHPSKKHFIFFNSPATLLFVHKLFGEITKTARPLMHIDKIYVLHEGMKDSAKFEQYNGFLSHRPERVQQQMKKKEDEFEAQRSVHPSHNHRLGRSKRSTAPPKASGAILLCTDIAAYGLDIRDVDYCYHFEPPQTVQAYIHRIGRVGRMGMRGSSLLLLPSHLARDNSDYFTMLKSACTLQLYKPPPAAPIVSALKSFVSGACLKEAKRAAMALGGPHQELFTPRQALQALLLMD